MKRYEKVVLGVELIGDLFNKITGGATTLADAGLVSDIPEKELIYSVDAFFVRGKNGDMELWVYDSAIRQQVKMNTP